MISKLLPEHCIPQRKLKKVDGVVIHYFSARGVDKPNKFDLYTCRNLMLDLNRNKADRQVFMRGVGWPGHRMHASAHIMIGREGETWQLVDFSQQAYHCGAGILNGRSNCNKWTIGIELIGDQHSGFTREQYFSLANTLNALEGVYGYSRDNVVGHDAVRHAAVLANPHKHYKNKYDPSGLKDGKGDNFDWFYLGKVWNDIKPNPDGVAGLDRLDDIIASDPLSA